MELTILMPCLNEAETVETCVRKAVGFLQESGVEGEVVVADNGSTDGSQKLASDAGARVVPIKEKGYGNALIGGITAAHGKYVIMGDADDSYDFTNLMPFVEELRNGHELVMGNRFKGGIEPGAMPKLHKYLGNPVLSFVGRLFFPSAIGDFHCGLRGFNRESALQLNLQATGMEFASEMVVKATLWGQKVTEVPTTLKKDGRSRPPHLRSWRDGWRHLRFLLLFSPRWLFLLPGALLFLLGLIAGAVVVAGPVTIGSVTFDVDTLVAASAAIVIGFQGVLFWMFTRVYAGAEGFLPKEPGMQNLLGRLSLERGLLLGLFIGIAGLVGIIFSIVNWGGSGFHNLNYEHELRLMIPSATALIVSCQLILGSFFLSILGIKQTRHTSAGGPVEAAGGGAGTGGPARVAANDNEEAASAR
jgi:glycosyltransferase involved in cell wall biosynthesis